MNPDRDIPTGGRPLLILSPKPPASAHVALVAEAGRCDVKVLTIGWAGRLAAVDRAATTWAAGAVAVCGDPRMQATVAAVAAGRDLPFGCIPSGPADLLARDMSFTPEDPERALKCFLARGERRMDLAEVNGVAFVNYVALGLRVQTVRRAEAQTGTPRLRARVTRGAPSGLRRLDASEPGSAPALIVSNNRFAVGPEGLGARSRMDAGVLGVAVFDSGVQRGCEVRWRERTSTGFEIPGSGPVRVDIDGAERLLHCPLRFRVIPHGLRVRASEAS